MIIILIGYMASGKSTLGKLLAKKLHYKFIDLDDYIEHEEGMPVKDIFKKKGELYFRKAETTYLNNIINKENDVVLSVGGGTPCYGNNMDVILQVSHVKSFYLKASLSHLVDRLKTKKSKRPLLSHLKTEDELKEFIGKHLFERSPYYDRANYKILIDNKSKKEIIKELLNALI
ncbi:shikimate kinase [Yeosuana aromativorans]|uniref:Shikimate kinase n=1 Tax=Yeosuana aromativorans TaxID=288019 RepID=A0A8J3BJK5_9FLAO|nr:shikimate kinase [Yeosuana aromativorans]GGK24224.1 shikimate kinase [Yeosuana aromativorans]